MQLLNAQQVINYMDTVRARQGRYRKYPFAGRGVGYSQNDPHCFPMDAGLIYSENIVFGDPNAIPIASLPNSGSLVSLNQTIANTQNLAAANQPSVGLGGGATPGAAPGPYNFSVLPFFAGANSIQILNSNPKRQALLVQNQDAANQLFFNLGQGAGLNQGILLAPTLGILWEIKVPSNYITVFSAAGARGIVAEGM